MYWGKKKKKNKGAGNSLRQIYLVAKIHVLLEQEGKWQVINMTW